MSNESVRKAFEDFATMIYALAGAEELAANNEDYTYIDEPEESLTQLSHHFNELKEREERLRVELEKTENLDINHRENCEGSIKMMVTDASYGRKLLEFPTVRACFTAIELAEIEKSLRKNDPRPLTFRR